MLISLTSQFLALAGLWTLNTCLLWAKNEGMLATDRCTELTDESNVAENSLKLDKVPPRSMSG